MWKVLSKRRGLHTKAVVRSAQLVWGGAIQRAYMQQRLARPVTSTLTYVAHFNS